jgi:LysM repeat protein
MPAPASRWARYAAPAAFLLAVTIAVLLVRSAIHGEPGTTTTTTPAPTVVRKQFYRVRAGDTLTSIARRFHVSVARLEQLNPRVRSTSLFIGQRIRVG